MQSLPFVTCVTATYNRHFHLERVVRFFIDQDYPGEHLLLIYNNHPLTQELAPITLPRNKRIILVNNSADYRTFDRYTNLGAIYRDALTHVPMSTDIICFWDDDDQYLPYHISEGVKGYQRAKEQGKIAYKPEKSFYRDTENKLHLAGNTLEPSIFIEASHVFSYGFKDSTVDQHFGWYSPLIEDNLLFIDPSGPSTFIYTWCGDVFKTSGNPHDQNFDNCRAHKGDVGDRMITPISPEEAEEFYKIG